MWYENSRNFSGVPWGHSRLRILHCHYCGEGSISSLGTFTCLGDNPPPKKRKIQWRKKLASMSLSCAGRLFWCQKNMQNLRLPSWMCFLYEINSTLLLAGVHMVMLRYPNPGAWEGSPRLFCWVALNISFLSICSHFRGYPHLQDFADSYRS